MPAATTYPTKQFRLFFFAILLLFLFYLYSFSLFSTTINKRQSKSECFIDKATKNHFCKPSFMIIGAPKCGTTALFNYLQRHPQVFPSVGRKNIFATICNTSSCTIEDYWKQFRVPEGIIHYKDMLTGEIASEYLSKHENGMLPKTLKLHLPKMKFIILLRDPVERTLSLYKQRKRDNEKTKQGKGFPALERVIAQNEEELRNCYSRSAPEKRKFCHSPSNILSSGLYVDDILEWLNYFPRNQFLFLNSQDLVRSPKQVMQKVFHFLGLSDIELSTVELQLPLPDEQVKDPVKLAASAQNISPPSLISISPSLKEYLCEFYKPSLAQVVKLTGLQLGTNCGYY